MVPRKRKHGIFKVPEGTNIVSLQEQSLKDELKKDALKIEEALEKVFQQMQTNGNRKRTIQSYQYIFKQFIEVTQLKYVEDISLDSIYQYLEEINVARETKLIRLKSIKAVLSHFYNNGWIKEKFWTVIQIKIDKKVKKGTSEEDIKKLIELIDVGLLYR